MKISFTFFMLFAMFFLQKGFSQSTVNLITPGSLSSVLSSDEKKTITNLKITGSINVLDILCMRDEMTNLAIIDMSESKIVSYYGYGTDGGGYPQMNYIDNSFPRKAFYLSGYYSGKGTLTSIVFPPDLTSIESFAFYGCRNIKTITIPNKVAFIGYNAFYSSGLTSITIPENVTGIGHHAFFNCLNLESLTILGKITSISEATFQSCTSLTSLIIPNDVASIGKSAFYGCTGLKSISIPSKTSSILDGAFCECTGLISVYNQRTTPVSISSSVFQNVNKTNCTLYVPIGSKTLYENANVWKEFNIVEYDYSISTSLNKAPTSSKIEIFPNPVISHINIVGIEHAVKVQVLNLNGQTLINEQTSGSVSMNNLPCGIYLIYIYDGDRIVEKRKITKL